MAAVGSQQGSAPGMLDITEQDQAFANHFIDTIRATGPEGYRLYAILDGAQDDRIYRNLQRFGDVSMSLYTNETAEQLKAAGPLLYQFRNDDKLTAWFIKHGAFANWFILFPSLGVTMVELRRHFKRFAKVLGPNGKPLYFRYYDPRVLTAYLPTTTDKERVFIFGDLACYWAYSYIDESLIKYAPDGQNLPLPALSKSGEMEMVG